MFRLCLLCYRFSASALFRTRSGIFVHCKSKLYEYKQGINSAMSYWHKVLQSEQLVQSQNAAKHLLQLSIKKNDARNGMNYPKLYHIGMLHLMVQHTYD